MAKRNRIYKEQQKNVGQLDGWGHGESIWKELSEGTQTEKAGAQWEANQILALRSLYFIIYCQKHTCFQK